MSEDKAADHGRVEITRQRQETRVTRGRAGIEIRRQGRPVASTTFGSGSARADIVFVIDTTGSMNDKIDGLLNTCQRFVDEIAERNIDWRIAVVGFGDLTVEGDKIVATSFGRNVEVIKKSLREIPRYAGGGNEGESSLEALQKAMGLAGYRQSAINVFILVTDEPALHQGLTPSGITRQLMERGVLTFVISQAQEYFKAMASETGGEWFQRKSPGPSSWP